MDEYWWGYKKRHLVRAHHYLRWQMWEPWVAQTGI